MMKCHGHGVKRDCNGALVKRERLGDIVLGHVEFANLYQDVIFCIHNLKMILKYTQQAPKKEM